jgi:SAM-dependent methyltransferase
MWPTDQNLRAWERRYADPGVDQPGLPEPVRERLPDLTGKHVLHLRCGTGEGSAELVALGALVSGIDPSAEALAVARERAPDAVFFQAGLDELPLQLRRRRFSLVYAGEGMLDAVRDLAQFASTSAAALRKNGELILYDWHPVAVCVDPVDLRWRDSYFAEGLWRLGQVVVAVSEGGFSLREVEELPPPPKETGGRLDPRMPTHFLLRATKVAASDRSG